jgi:hypothetical protein
MVEFLFRYLTSKLADSCEMWTKNDSYATFSPLPYRKVPDQTMQFI